MSKPAGQSMKAWVAAHTAKPDDEKADQSLTVYVTPSELAKIEEIKKRASTTRQAVLHQLIISGLEQFNAETRWWK